MRLTILLLTLFTTITIQAQNLPRSLSPDEQFESFEGARATGSITTPPTIPVRTAAEWEEMKGYMITWTSYTSMLREIVRYGREECRMYIICSNANNVYTDLLNNGIDTSNVTCIVAPYNSVWSRDYGHNNVYYNGVDSLAFVDWMYNRPRPKDDTVPAALARYLGVTLYETTQAPYNLVNTGGNWMSDGMGTAFASELILDDNKASAGFGTNHTEAEIDTIMSKFHGIKRYIKMETLPYDGIHHIDMHMKLLDEETILVGEYPQGVADGPQIEANLQYVLSNFQTSFGTPWRVVRMPMPKDGSLWPSTGGDYMTYTNASFINKTIIVPTYGIATDTTALRIWREACPGYRVVGINSTSSIPASGALHCITHEIGVDDPLLINVKRLPDTYNTTSPYNAFAYIEHRSGIQSATLYYTTDTTQPFQQTPMFDVFGDHYEANIPAQPAGTEVFYYVYAQANSGKQQVRPITAPNGFYSFKVLGTTSVKEVENQLNIQEPFPNPSHGITCLPLTTANPQRLTIECYNTLGEKVKTVFDGLTRMGDNKYFINTEGFAAGLYVIRYTTTNGTFTKPLVVR